MTLGADAFGIFPGRNINTSIFDDIPSEKIDVRQWNSSRQNKGQPAKLHHAEFRSPEKDGATSWTRNFRADDRYGDREQMILSFPTTRPKRMSSRRISSYQATHDWLTGLVNRREFESRLKSLIESAARENSRHALCFVDLDQFRIINDSFGHIVGDEFLRQIGALLNISIREEDTLARLGGDEFGVLAVNRTLEEAEEMGRTLCRVIDAHPFIWRSHKFTIGASIGIAPINESSGRVVDVLRAADQACYAAKEQGRNRVHVYREHDPDLQKRHVEMDWINRIHRASRKTGFIFTFSRSRR